MKISTKGRYALRVMIDLAQNADEKYISLKDVAERQQISMKYLEMIEIFFYHKKINHSIILQKLYKSQFFFHH